MVAWWQLAWKLVALYAVGACDDIPTLPMHEELAEAT